MAFRYMNPGLAALLDNDCVSTQVTGEQYSKTGVAFTQTNSAGVTLPDFAEGDDFWARFDAYIPTGVRSETYVYVKQEKTSGIRLVYAPANVPNTYILRRRMGNDDEIARGNFEAMNLRIGEVNNLLLHVVFGSTGVATVEFFINGKKFSENPSGGISYNSNYVTKAMLYSSSNNVIFSNVIFSNVIFSNEEISTRERVISLPVTATTTDMASGMSGIYVADAANQQLLQSGSLSALAERYGADSVVTGVEVVGNPAYATGAGITTLTGISKSGGVVAEHGKYFLTDDTSAKIFDGWGLSGVTVGDLANMQFGWKVEV